ncbi:S8 family serine peptidase [Bacillus massilinigeriensis]|uniref:S8 family serine peptidase n=1 Tax=Bacillus mediterraneensis TaxID=1805474 RepID=UPI0008F85FFF|nr:S8 family serine peptidase [Bacillus mediterraneensis]
MKKSLFTVLLTCVISILLAAGPASLRTPPLPREDSTRTVTAIVITKTEWNHAQIQKFANAHPGLKIRHVFRHALIGFSVRGELQQVEELKSHFDIQAVSEVQSYRAESLPNMKIIGSEEVRGIFDAKGQRLTGKGVIVGVIDTGVDYHHPDLRKNYRGGRDLVDGDNDPMESQNLGLADTLHGTHVAGIIAANGKISGIAPDASIKAYRALGPGGFGTTEQVLAAIDKAIEDKVDVLNLSLGNEVNGPDLPISLALNKAVEQGIVAVTSSGNSGPNNWTVGSPGTAAKAISVGASTPPLKVPHLTFSGENKNIKIVPLQGSVAWEFDRSIEIVDGGIGREEDVKNASGKIVLAERGEISFTDKARHANKAGAMGIIIYNNTKGSFSGNLEEPLEIPVAAVTREEGLRFKKIVQKGNAFSRIVLIEESDQLADFSSRGPVTVTWDMKPDVVAPGVAIESTIPGGYMTLQGTSMAAPHVAGAAALLKQNHPDWTPDQIKSALMNTARPIHNEHGVKYKAYEQGAGRISIADAVHARTLVLPGALRFGKFSKAESTGASGKPSESAASFRRSSATERSVEIPNIGKPSERSGQTNRSERQTDRRTIDLTPIKPIRPSVSVTKERHVAKILVENHHHTTQRYAFEVPSAVQGIEWQLPMPFELAPNGKMEVEIGLHADPRKLQGKIHDGTITLHTGGKDVRIPYLYVFEEPDYPRVMGFEFAQGDKGGYRYEVYLPGGAEEFSIALFDQDSFRFRGFLDYGRDLNKGLLKRDLPNESLPPDGSYIAKVSVKKAGREDVYETIIMIGPPGAILLKR